MNEIMKGDLITFMVKKVRANGDISVGDGHYILGSVARKHGTIIRKNYIIKIAQPPRYVAKLYYDEKGYPRTWYIEDSKTKMICCSYNISKNRLSAEQAEKWPKRKPNA